jgi:hypothetical protein
MMASLATARRRITAEDEHMFRTHATMLRGVLEEMKSREDFQRTLRALDYVISHFATLTLVNDGCVLKPPQSAWGAAIWAHLLAMADLKSHADALEEVRRTRDQLVKWPTVLSA